MKKNIKKIIIIIGVILIIFTISTSVSTAYSVITNEATNITETEATLSGVAGSAGTKEKQVGYFRYSTATFPPVFCNDIYGSDMEATNEVCLSYDQNCSIFVNITTTFKIKVDDLLPNTTYYYCAVSSDKTQINYGNVKSFTTKPKANDSNSLNSSVSITTKPALVVNENSAYLNGFYNSLYSSETYFEYRKNYEKNINSIIKAPTQYMPVPEINTGLGGSLMGGLHTFSVPKIYTGLTSGGSISTPELLTPPSINTPISETNNGWTKVNTQNHNIGNGTLNFLLTGLSSNTNYQFRAVIKTTSNETETGSIIYGNILTFKTSQTKNVFQGDVSNENNNQTPLTLGQKATPPVDAVVHYLEGIENVLARQIIANSDIAKKYGYKEGADLNAFAWNLADLLARKFGYVNSKGKEIRVSKPDIAAYELRLSSGGLTVYEYYNNKIVHIQKLSSILRNKYNYEYYFNKK